MPFILLPIVLYEIINEYIYLNNLCYSCNYFYKELKKYKYLKLNIYYSLKYYEDYEFRNIILSKIINPNKQLYLNFKKSYITDVNILHNVHGLDLSYTNIRDISSLYKLYVLNLQNCKNIFDIPYFENIHTLNLKNCKNITNINSLSNIHTLDISFTNISDISMLSNIHTLNISYCKNINNICNLKNIRNLDIYACYGITDINVFNDIYNITDNYYDENNETKSDISDAESEYNSDFDNDNS